MFYSLIITAKEHIDLPILLPPSTSLAVEVGRWKFMNLNLPWIRAKTGFFKLSAYYPSVVHSILKLV